MYFSLITPKNGLEREAAIQWSKGPYEQHQWLWQFMDAAPGTTRDFLFRRRDGEKKLPGFYLVSARKPEPISSAWDVKMMDYDPKLQAGQQLEFALRANPIVSHKIDGKAHRDDVIMHEKKKLLTERGLQRWSDWPNSDPEKPLLYDLVQSTCVHWLEKRAEGNGFKLVSTHDGSKTIRVDGYTQHMAGKKEISFTTVDFTGELVVTNPELFKKTLFNGMGKAKAFGCGLMLIKRI
ncbi:MAG: CRISPR-associated CSE3 family protein [uncultured bacterium]|nr:MAG: CRISPR-associated CSE3 family protein [uncultured bacterium]